MKTTHYFPKFLKKAKVQWIIRRLSMEEFASVETIKSLVLWVDDSTLEMLFTALHDAHPVVRAGVAKALGELGNPKAIDPLRRRLEECEGENLVREYVIKALGIIGDERVAGLLLQILNDRHENIYLREKAAASLVSIASRTRTQRSIGLLFHVLREKRSGERARRKAAEELSNNHDVDRNVLLKTLEEILVDVTEESFVEEQMGVAFPLFA